MKKLFSLLLVLIITAGVCACGGSGSDETESDVPKNTDEYTTVQKTEEQVKTEEQTTAAEQVSAEEMVEHYSKLFNEYESKNNVDGENFLKHRVLFLLEMLKKSDWLGFAGHINATNPMPYRFIKDTKIKSAEIVESFDSKFVGVPPCLFKIKLNVSESLGDKIPAGENYWYVEANDNLGITLFEKCEKNSKPKDIQISDSADFCYNFSSMLGIFDTADDFNKVIKNKSDVYFLHEVYHFYSQTKVKEFKKASVQAIYDYMEKSTGITGLDYAKTGANSHDYDPVEKTYQCPGHGGNWCYWKVVREDFDKASGIYTTVIDYYSDSALFMVAKTIRYTHKKDADGTNIMLSTELLYDSKYDMAWGSV